MKHVTTIKLDNHRYDERAFLELEWDSDIDIISFSMINDDGKDALFKLEYNDLKKTVDMIGISLKKEYEDEKL